VIEKWFRFAFAAEILYPALHETVQTSGIGSPKESGEETPLPPLSPDPGCE
jgi:hypothetical protein